MAAGKSHLEIFKDALQDPEVPADPILTLEAPSVMLRIRWVEQMPWIALSIGVEATRKELVTFLTSKVTETFNSDAFVEGLEDEVLTHLAVVLGDFADYVGGPSEAWCLLEPLFALCNTDETLVREAAVKSIIQLSEKIALEPKGP
jgi:serine/threonine-protein phosphatase 2A regulatory subunit A